MELRWLPNSVAKLVKTKASPLEEREARLSVRTYPLSNCYAYLNNYLVMVIAKRTVGGW